MQEYLKANNITVHAYTALADKVKQYGESLEDKKILFDDGAANYLACNLLKENGFTVVNKQNVIALMKMVKNEKQMEGMR